MARQDRVGRNNGVDVRKQRHGSVVGMAWLGHWSGDAHGPEKLLEWRY